MSTYNTVWKILVYKEGQHYYISTIHKYRISVKHHRIAFSFIYIWQVYSQKQKLHVMSLSKWHTQPHLWVKSIVFESHNDDMTF